jgi:hypothetical protein
MYVLVALMFDDGGEDYAGRRMWSHEFRTREAAQTCLKWLNEQKLGIQVNIFDDFNED